MLRDNVGVNKHKEGSNGRDFSRKIKEKWLEPQERFNVIVRLGKSSFHVLINKFDSKRSRRKEIQERFHYTS